MAGLDQVPAYLRYLLSGIEVTITVTILGIVVAIVAATLGGLGRLSPNRLVRTIAGAYIEFFRGTSALVQMFWIFYALPLVGVDITPLTAGVLGLGLNVGAYGAEVVRAGITSVPRGQIEAAIALNFSGLDRLRLIVVRPAVQLMIPPANNLFIALLKGTALVSLITLADLTLRSQSLRAQTGNSALVLGLTLLIYFALAMVLTAAMRAIAKAVAYPGSDALAKESGR
jgi:polar amino acid transport system permease protein